MKKEASFWRKQAENKVQCLLCPHSCIISEGKRGRCRVRENTGGTLFTLIYGSASSVAADPIEKKPLYHFHPGSSALSLGTVGCNLSCKHCQNYSISAAKPEDTILQELTPDEPVKLAREYGCTGIAWTYNEPSIWHEFSVDASKVAKRENLYVVYVSNGFINEEPFREIGEYLDAINIDVKSFNDQFYREICGAHLQPVLDTCKLAKDLNIHLEVTYLVIPSLNDSMDEIGRFCDWVLDALSADTPIHFTRFYPHYKTKDRPSTPIETLRNAYALAQEKGLKYVYLGNVPPGDYDNTFCPNCGTLLIERYGFSSEIRGLKDGRCSNCGEKIPVIIG
ncbi:MAG TPA: AmmeMemoRadiSam system radical SAM enzyme [Thermoplasmatales archaeon]|nr:AmmeMemoRadiSam system radical SAM enzyme [Thermoplasmatales archaeon]